MVLDDLKRKVLISHEESVINQNEIYKKRLTLTRRARFNEIPFVAMLVRLHVPPIT